MKYKLHANCWKVLFLYSSLLLFSPVTLSHKHDLSQKKSASTIQTEFRKIKYQDISVLVLSGNYYQMGVQYGGSLKKELQESLKILKDFYIKKHGLTNKKLLEQAEILYVNFPLHYQSFLKGASSGSGLPLSDIKILNAMETLGSLLPLSKSNAPKCAFLFIPSFYTSTDASMIGRNYDYPPPFNKLSQYLTVTILKPKGEVPTAFISLAGEVYCPSCINEKGIFMELNNGSPSGGWARDTNTMSMLIKMLITLQNSANMSQVIKKMSHVKTDYSLIVNAGNARQLVSFEYSSSKDLGMQYQYYPYIDQPYASTNFFLNAAWNGKIPTPTDATTWQGVTRRNNLLHLSASNAEKFNINSFKSLMGIEIAKGGAVRPFTIYQMIVDQSNLVLYIKIRNHSNEWIKIPLKPLFKRGEANKEKRGLWEPGKIESQTPANRSYHI